MNAAKADAEPTTETNKPLLTGYSNDVQFLATKYKQGGRIVYSLDLSPAQIASLVAAPDPSQTSPGNRAIRPAHADGFAKYVRERPDWTSPGLILRASRSFDFEVTTELAGVQFGILSIPRRSLLDLHILDGQHRTLGFIRAEKGIADDLDKARSALASARRVDPKGAAVKEAQDRIADLETQSKRLENERLHVQIVVEQDAAAYKQMFFDIADNALGITASVKTRFDSRKVVNRSLDKAMEHILLLGRVDPEGDRTGRNSPYLMGAKHVAEIIRTLAVGLDGRVSRKQEATLKTDELALNTTRFFDVLIEAFPPMRALSLGQLTPEMLRKSSLLGSVLFMRALAGTYYELIEDHHWPREDVEAFFAKISPHTEAPVYPQSIWMSEMPGVFSDGGYAPHGRRQDLKLIKDRMVVWALDKPKFLDKPPAPRPVAISDAEEDQADYGKGYLDFGADIPEGAAKPKAPVAAK